MQTIAEWLEQKGRRIGREEGIHEGRSEGRTEGEQAATLRIARNMLHSGLELAMIARLTGLSEQELLNLCR